MVNKKYLLLAGLCSVLSAQPAMAQESETTTASWSGRDMTYRGENYDVLDSSYYTGKGLEQYRRYMNHQSVFPPKPNNMWEIGINLGGVNVIGDVPSKSVLGAKKFTDAIGLGLTVRKAWGYTFSLRFEYMYGRASGYDYRSIDPINPGWKLYKNSGEQVYENYRTVMHEFSLQLIAATNNIRFHKGKNNFSLYAFAGPGLVKYKVNVNRLNGDSLYDFTLIPGYGTDVDNKDRKTAGKAVKNLLDDTYEQNIRDRTDFIIAVGIGAQFKLSDRVSFQLEDKISLPFKDYVDGVEFSADHTLSPDKDLYNYASIGLGINLGNKTKKVLPLWWVNPLDYAYSELSDPRHMRLPEPILPDADGDGVADQFDKCPGTPAGVAVDTHGCPLDTDGDGVPDYKDKQLITPTECQPVDADGVGHCPCPEGCGGAAVSACGNITPGSLSFSGGSSTISPGMANQLSNLAAQMQANPTCKVVIVGNGNSSKVQQQRSWDRVNSVITYMSDKSGIDRNRFIFQYGGTGDENTVMFRSANQGEEGPSNVAPPFPNLRK